MERPSPMSPRNATGTKAKPEAVDDPAKIERFKALARELGCDESEEAFDAVLGRLATSGPVPKHEPKKRQRKS
jgi:hypothetical protein